MKVWRYVNAENCIFDFTKDPGGYGRMTFLGTFEQYITPPTKTVTREVAVSCFSDAIFAGCKSVHPSVIPIDAKNVRIVYDLDVPANEGKD